MRGFRLGDLPLGLKLLAGFGLVLLLLAVLSAAAYRSAVENEAAADWVSHTLEVVARTNAVEGAVADMQNGFRGYLLTGQDQFLDQYAADQREMDANLAELERMTADNPDQVARWADIRNRVRVWQQQRNEPLIRLRREVNAGTANIEDVTAIVGNGEGQRQVDEIRRRLNDAARVEQEFLAQRRQALNANTAALRQTLVFGTGLAVLLGVALAWAVSRDVAGAVNRIATTADRIADGDRDERIGLDRRDELGRAAAAFDRMTEQLDGTITRNEELIETAEARARELARSNAELEQFAYVASHDLQEPLRAIVSYLQLIERRYKGQLDERADRYIGHAVDGSRRMQTLINDLLAYSRVGRKGEAFAEVDTAAVLAHAERNLHAAIEESGAEITRGDLPVVTGDAGQLGQLFQNLVGNALKFRGEAPPRIDVSAERRADGWEFAVRDNGIGIAPEYRDRIFVIFQRLHGRDEFPGTGIGLAICKKIVERHGGRLWVDSEPGAGSTFRFTLADHPDLPESAGEPAQPVHEGVPA